MLLTVFAFVLVFAALGLTGFTVVGRRREQRVLRAELERQFEAGAALANRMRLFAEVTRVATATGDVRRAVCTAARTITGATRAYLVEPDGQGHLATTAVAGEGMPPFVLNAEDPSMSPQVMARPRYVLEPELESQSRAADAVEAIQGMVSGAWQPVLRGEAALGVIGLLFDTRTEALSADALILLEALAAYAAAAIERDDLRARLTQVADRDPLTGLPNRRRWDETCSAESARARRTDSRLSFVLIELNDFETFTERFGQLAGEGLLRQFASSTQGALREVDTIAHWGGAVFAVALPSCSAQDAQIVAKRIRTSVPQGQSCTIGIAEWQPGKTLEDVLAEAEAPLPGASHPRGPLPEAALAASSR